MLELIQSVIFFANVFNDAIKPESQSFKKKFSLKNRLN